MNFLKTFESFQHDPLIEYYEALRLLPEFFNEVELKNGVHQGTNKKQFNYIIFYSNEIDPLTNNNWKFNIAMLDGKPNTLCIQNGDSCDTNSLAELFNYTSKPETVVEIWKTLIQKDPRYQIECPVNVLEELKSKLHKPKQIGVFESNTN